MIVLQQPSLIIKPHLRLLQCFVATLLQGGCMQDLRGRKNPCELNIFYKLTCPVAAELTSSILASLDVYPLTAILLPVCAACR